jgi:hypothetical protein
MRLDGEEPKEVGQGFWLRGPIECGLCSCKLYMNGLIEAMPWSHYDGELGLQKRFAVMEKESCGTSWIAHLTWSGGACCQMVCQRA